MVPSPPIYLPDFDSECEKCDAVPTVVLEGQSTGLCGMHFFGGDRSMVDWELWNDDKESSE